MTEYFEQVYFNLNYLIITIKTNFKVFDPLLKLFKVMTCNDFDIAAFTGSERGFAVVVLFFGHKLNSWD